MTALIRAEILKIRTTRMWWGLLLGALAFTALFVLGTVLTADSTISGAGQMPGIEDPSIVRSTYGSGFGGAYFFACILGIIEMSGEYRHQTITPTLLTVPRRGRLVVAKLVTYAILGLLMGLVATAFAVALGGALIASRGGDLMLTSNDVPLTLLLSVFGVGVWGVFGLGLGTLLRNQIAAILAAVGFTLILEPIATALLNNYDLGGVAKWLPGNATQSIVQGVDQGFEMLPWWGGALVLSGYGLAFAAIGAALTLRRDVT